MHIELWQRNPRQGRKAGSRAPAEVMEAANPTVERTETAESAVPARSLSTALAAPASFIGKACEDHLFFYWPFS